MGAIGSDPDWDWLGGELRRLRSEGLDDEV